jgi:hypothetical protein
MSYFSTHCRCATRWNSLKVVRLQDGQSVAIFYPFGHLTLYAYGLSTKVERKKGQMTTASMTRISFNKCDFQSAQAERNIAWTDSKNCYFSLVGRICLHYQLGLIENWGGYFHVCNCSPIGRGFNYLVDLRVAKDLRI